MDLIRTILMELEARPSPRDVSPVTVSEYSPEDVSYHVKLLSQAGLIEALDAETYGGFEWIPTSLTWLGHEFLDAARNETVWNRLKAEMKARGGTLPFELVQQLAMKLVAAMAGLPS
jgi:hypothetical protein